jgi:hypothetical protein
MSSLLNLELDFFIMPDIMAMSVPKNLNVLIWIHENATIRHLDRY